MNSAKDSLWITLMLQGDAGVETLGTVSRDEIMYMLCNSTLDDIKIVSAHNTFTVQNSDLMILRDNTQETYQAVYDSVKSSISNQQYTITYIYNTHGDVTGIRFIQ